MRPLEWTRLAAALLVLCGTLGVPAWIVLAAGSGSAGAQAPRELRETGLYADPSTQRIASDVLAFRPQYPLWTDGARKRRWIRLPAGSSIDASDPDAWRFPVGTQLWKEFAYERRVETRYMQLGGDGRWVYATYVWSPDGRSASLAPQRGLRGACQSTSGAPHDIPSELDCRACHQGTPSEVLGFSALQLSSARASREPGDNAAELQLDDFIARGWIRDLPREFRERAPQIAARSERERAVLGYLHGNCASCHNARGPLAELGLDLEFSLARGSSAVRTSVGVESRFQLAELERSERIVPGAPHASVLFRRISSRDPLLQMPALGTHVVDTAAVELVSQWIEQDLAPARLADTHSSHQRQR